MKYLLCILFHDWSRWEEYLNGNYQHRTCARCGKTHMRNKFI